MPPHTAGCRRWPGTTLTPTPHRGHRPPRPPSQMTSTRSPWNAPSPATTSPTTTSPQPSNTRSSTASPPVAPPSATSPLNSAPPSAPSPDDAHRPARPNPGADKPDPPPVRAPRSRPHAPPPAGDRTATTLPAWLVGTKDVGHGPLRQVRPTGGHQETPADDREHRDLAALVAVIGGHVRL